MASSVFLFFFLANLQPQEKDPFENSRINFVYEENDKGKRGYLTFNSRWDFNDAKKFYFLPLSFYKSASRIDLSRDVKFKYYGYGIRPFKIINIQRLSSSKPDISGENSPPAKTENAEKQRQADPGKKRKRGFISLSPLYEDITENAYDFILENSLKPLSPQWASVSREGKKEFFKDLYSTGLFDNFLLMPVGGALYEISENKQENTKK